MDSGLQLKDEATGQTYCLDHESMILGRTSPGYPVDPGFLHIEHETVSRRHAQLVWSGGAYQLTNLSTTNPIHINGHKVEQCQLKAGDMLQLGECVLNLVSTRITIKPRPPLQVQVGTQTIVVTGYTVALGGAGGTPDRWYDQEIVVEGLPAQCLCLAWKDIAGRYELSYRGLTRPPVHITRVKGELEWLSTLPPDRPGGVRPGDLICVGEAEVRLF